MTVPGVQRNRKSVIGSLSWPLALAFASLAVLLAPAQASAQIPPQTWPGRDYCSDVSAPSGVFRAPNGGYSYLNINFTAPGGVGAEMYGTSASNCLEPASPRCSSNPCRVRVQTVCEFHCQHDHNAPYGWTVQLFPTGGNLLGWPGTSCLAFKDVPQSYCIVRMPVNGEVNAWAKFGTEPDFPPAPAPVASVSDVGPYWMTVSWTPSTDDHWLGGYMIMNGATELARVGPGTTRTNLEALSCQTTYNIQVVAFDAVNRAPSNVVPQRTGACIGSSDRTRPNTVFHVKPPKVTRSRTASFHWGANERSRFRCKLDRRPWAKCRRSDPYVTSMGKTYRRLRPGRHTFRVYAIDRAGNREARPAVYTWRIRR